MTSLVQIVLNGQPAEVPPTETLADLLIRFELNQRSVAVEVNTEIVPRERHAQHRLMPGDHVEVVTLVGGG